MTQLIVEFTDQEKQVLREHQIAIFRSKVILKAQPPASDEQLAEVQSKVDGKLSPDLVALWRTAFGGELDYDYEILFGDHLYSASLRQLFYPNSGHYHDLYGWIEHELELAQAAAEENEEPIPQNIAFVPFGGFEYLERFFVTLEPESYGTVIAYAQGNPWKGQLNEDSVASVADSLFNLFDQLCLYEDPFAEQADQHTQGKDMVGLTIELQESHPELADKLKRVIQGSIFDWQGIVDAADFSKPLSAIQSKALRLALRSAAKQNSIELIDQLHTKSAPFNIAIGGTCGVLEYAITNESFQVVERLLDLDIDLGDVVVDSVSNCPNDLIQKLIERGFSFDEEAIYTAAETGAIDSAMSLVLSNLLADFKPVIEFEATALERAEEHESAAEDIESGILGSYLTADQYREQAQNLRRFAKLLDSNE